MFHFKKGDCMGESLEHGEMGLEGLEAAKSPESLGKSYLEKTMESLGKGVEEGKKFIGNAATVLLGTAMMEFTAFSRSPNIPDWLNNMYAAVPNDATFLAIGAIGFGIFAGKLLKLQRGETAQDKFDEKLRQFEKGERTK